MSNIFTVGNLSPGTKFTFNITCLIGGAELPGLSKVIEAKTKACTSKFTAYNICYSKDSKVFE